MMLLSTREWYTDRKKLINQSVDYIMKHLDGNLSLDAVVAHFSISKCHFSRIFKEETGESVYVFIKRRKVDQSVIDMKLNPAKAITDIGLDYGYSAPNYSSVFRQYHDTSSSMFRQLIPTRSMFLPFSSERIVHFKTAEKYTAQIEVQKQEDLSVLYECFIGIYADLEKNWYQSLDKYKDFLNEKTFLVGRFFNGPAITSPLQCICDICMIVGPDCGLSNVIWISGGRWITYHFNGKTKDISETLEGIFSIRFPQSSYKMTRRYGLNIYRRIDQDNHSVIMDLYIPIS